jgi:O-acetyl-ADP-ribose deacetylase (regulator of RNase III)
MQRIRVVRESITKISVDAIVNAANEYMLGGGGVDGVIHDSAGPELLEACRAVPEVRPGVRCPTGEARITPGFRLSARFVVHTVGPVWRGGRSGEPELLASCYRNSLLLARQNGLRSIAFPAISCGAFGYPVELAASVAVTEVLRFLSDEPLPEHVVLATIERKSHAALTAALAKIRDRRLTSECS